MLCYKKSRNGFSVSIRCIFVAGQQRRHSPDADTPPVRRHFHLKHPRRWMMGAVMTSFLWQNHAGSYLTPNHAAPSHTLLPPRSHTFSHLIWNEKVCMTWSDPNLRFNKLIIITIIMKDMFPHLDEPTYYVDSNVEIKTNALFSALWVTVFENCSTYSWAFLEGASRPGVPDREGKSKILRDGLIQVFLSVFTTATFQRSA